MSRFYLIWQDPASRAWHPVGLLQHDHGVYVFAYTVGARASKHFIPFGNMTRLEAVYLSEKLFPIFANRVMSEKRPEYQKYAKWSGFTAGEDDPLLLMARMGGLRATDTLQVYQAPEKTREGRYQSVFYCHGIRHMPESAQARALECKNGDRLFPMLDVQNPYDADAIALRTDDPTTMVGYCPRHVSTDIKRLCRENTSEISVTVHQTNKDAPQQFQLLLKVDARWPENFKPCSGEEYSTMTDVKSLLESHFSSITAVPQSRGAA